VEVSSRRAGEYCQVKDSIGWICEALSLKPRLDFTGGERGWIGDILSSFSKRKKSNPRLEGEPHDPEGILRTLALAQGQPWVFETRH